MVTFKVWCDITSPNSTVLQFNAKCASKLFLQIDQNLTKPLRNLTVILFGAQCILENLDLSRCHGMRGPSAAVSLGLISCNIANSTPY